MCCEVWVCEECWPRLNEYEKIIRLRLPLNHGVNFKAPGRRRIVKVEVELEKTDSYLVQGHGYKLYESQSEAVRVLSCRLKCFKQLNTKSASSDITWVGLDTHAVIKLQAVDLEFSLDSVEFVRNAGTEFTVVGERVRSL